MSDLTGWVAAITGTSAGIGQATARALVAEGMKVVGGARRADRLEDLSKELGDAFLPVEMDVRSAADGGKLVQAAIETFGKLDVLIPNAGIGVYGGIMDQTDEQVAAMIDTNVTGTVWPIRAAVPGMVAAGGGDIVIVASVAGIRGASPDVSLVQGATPHNKAMHRSGQRCMLIPVACFVVPAGLAAR